MNLKSFATIFLIALAMLLAVACGEEQSEEAPASKDGKSTDAATPTKNRGVPVEAMIVRSKAIEQNIPLIGVLQPLHAVDIVAEVSGKAEKIYKELGEAVTPADTLAVIDDRIPLSNYRQAKSQVLSAENNLKIARLNLRSDEALFKNDDISQLTYENSVLTVKTAEAELLSAKANLSLLEKAYRDTRITSPITGRISRKFIELGMMVTSNMPLYRVVDLHTLKAKLGVPQSMISRVKVGSPITATISALGNRAFDGAVRYISPQADENTGAFTAEIHVKNTDEAGLLAGMTAKIELTLVEMGKQLVIPDHALVSKDGKNYVYKIMANTARLTEIAIAESIGSQAIIAGGLAEGDTVVVVGMKNLGVETKVWIETVH